ncbi:hypothetical protein [Bacteroides sp. 51]|nr:hypothetical protein [Bacteroides sp. 51]
MTKERLNQMCEEYQRVLSMNEEEVQQRLRVTDRACIADLLGR